MRRKDGQDGAALVIVLVITLIFATIGTVMLFNVDREAQLRTAFQRKVTGHYAAEAGLNYGAPDVRHAILARDLPKDCQSHTIGVGSRTVVYQLSGCGQAPIFRLLADPPFESLRSQSYSYTLNSRAINAAGRYTEASLDEKFTANFIPMFQFATFYSQDLESSGPATNLSGRIHAGGNLYLNSDDCYTGRFLQGQITAGDALVRGRKDMNSNTNWIWIADATGTPRIVGTDTAGSKSCTSTSRRTIEGDEAATWGGRLATGVRNITAPSEDSLLCTPWSCPGAKSNGSYWTRANIRIVLDTTSTKQLVPGDGPALYPVVVQNEDGYVDPNRTVALQQFMISNPGALTYSDIPTAIQHCHVVPECLSAYANAAAYTPSFPMATGNSSCRARRNPRETIIVANYCYDYRYGGFYNWRESKPILMLNLDWIALEEWNLRNGGLLFSPAEADSSPNKGVVIFLSIRGPNASGANNYGVRIYDAGRVRRNTSDLGLTFASDDATYLVGNFNCPLLNMVIDSVQMQCGTNGSKKPASIVADTVNVLSCAWIDGNDKACGTVDMDSDQWGGVGYFRLRDERSTEYPPLIHGYPASVTVLDAAVLSGSDPTWCPHHPEGLDCGAMWYGGGLENHFRFHEKWDGTRFWFQGSVVSVGTPKHTCFAFASQVITGVTDDTAFGCNVSSPMQGFWSQQRFSPPIIRWSYDTSFGSDEGLPPLTPRAVMMTQHWVGERAP